MNRVNSSSPREYQQATAFLSISFSNNIKFRNFQLANLGKSILTIPTWEILDCTDNQILENLNIPQETLFAVLLCNTQDISNVFV